VIQWKWIASPVTKTVR